MHELEEQEKTELENLRNNFHGLLESLTPGNMVRNIFHHVAESPKLKRRAIVSVAGVAATTLLTGFLRKKMKSHKAEIRESVPGSGVIKIISPVLQLLLGAFLKKRGENRKRDSETVHASRVY